ncbi:Uu.00g059210.m01.CDS01 [Anthostomella pinea]|uniref:Uu.00g059210.m01.CDS01 n=1 Tax=Anthostomella pinea TaxID=933095 RepID=A0AAI8YJX9_9PEZI|nr:Uu.00g059210.m01.CDS01 [Anthostomella pinea]
MTALRPPLRQLLLKLHPRSNSHPQAALSRRTYSNNKHGDGPPTPIDIDAIRAKMLSRPPQIWHDDLHPHNSRLLDTALADFLPASCQPLRLHQEQLPAAHHLLYFPLRLPGSALCPDGTDPYHKPAEPAFARRMWAGGSIRDLDAPLALDGRPAVCVERIADVSARGAPGAEKIFVEVSREYVDREGLSTAAGVEHGTVPTGVGISERRTLVFMRMMDKEARKQALATSLKGSGKALKVPIAPDFSVTLTPTPTLLFHYSALTYNAHAIHLDRAYCREEEGHRDLLVHGPLALTLMLSVLRSRLASGNNSESIHGIDYRNFAPLYVNEPLRVCVALKGGKPRETENEEGKSNGTAKKQGGIEQDGGAGEKPKQLIRRKWDVWVENKDGGLSVRGTAESRGVPGHGD